MLETRHLKLIQAIVREGGLAKASERLHLTPSALSHQLRQLETSCGVPLFRRVGRRLVLEEAGRAVLDAADRLLPELRRVEQTLEAIRNEPPDRLRLSTECYTCYHWMPRALTRVAKELAGTRLEICPQLTRRPLDALRQGELELAIVSSTDGEHRDLASAPIFSDEMVVVTHPDHRWTRRSFVRPADLAKEVLLLYSADPAVSSLLGEVLHPAGVEPETVREVPLTEAILELVKAGQGVSFLARWAVEAQVADGTLAAVRIGREGHRRHWRLVCRERSPAARYLAQLAAIVADEIRPSPQ